MAQRLTYFPALSSLLALALVGGCGDKLAPGCATPEAVLPRMVAAVPRGDHDDLAMCFAGYVIDSPEAAHRRSGLLMLTREVQKTIMAGVKKYGARDFAAWLGSMRSFFLSCWMSTPEERLLQKGTLTLNGHTATSVYAREDQPNDFLYTHPGLKAYDALFHFPGLTINSSITLVQIDGRWYESMTARDADTRACCPAICRR